MRVRKKPVIVDAVQYTGDNGGEVSEFLEQGEADWQDPAAEDNHLVIHTLEGDHKAMPGDWIIRGVHGEHYPCKPEIFDATYEVVGE